MNFHNPTQNEIEITIYVIVFILGNVHLIVFDSGSLFIANTCKGRAEVTGS